MRNILIAVVMVCSLVNNSAFASSELSAEVSGLLQEKSFHKELLEQKKVAASQGRTLRIVSLEVLDLGSTKYVYANLATKMSAELNGQLTPMGSIVGSISYGPMGEIGFDGIFYKPAEEGPGGASVGNN